MSRYNPVPRHDPGLLASKYFKVPQPNMGEQVWALYLAACHKMNVQAKPKTALKMYVFNLRNGSCRVDLYDPEGIN